MRSCLFKNWKKRPLWVKIKKKEIDPRFSDKGKMKQKSSSMKKLKKNNSASSAGYIFVYVCETKMIFEQKQGGVYCPVCKNGENFAFNVRLNLTLRWNPTE